MSIEEEIKYIHDEYDKGNKSVKPSFKYIVMLPMDDDFDVANDLEEAKEKAIKYGNMNHRISEIFEVILAKDGTYRADKKFIYYDSSKELEDIWEFHAMHIAWRTRGDYLGGKYENSNKRMA